MKAIHIDGDGVVAVEAAVSAATTQIPQAARLPLQAQNSLPEFRRCVNTRERLIFKA